MNPAPKLCTRAEVLINRRLDGEITVEETHELDKHLCDCSACKREERMANALEALLTSVRIPDTNGAKERLKLRVAEVLRPGLNVPLPHSSRLLKFSPPPRKRWVAVAAVVALALTAGLAGYMLRANRAEPSVAAFSLRYPDRLAAVEALERLAVQAAVQDDAKHAGAFYVQMTETLLASLSLEQLDAQDRRELAGAYMRSVHEGLLPLIREGRLGRVAPEALRAQSHELSRLGGLTSEPMLAEAHAAALSALAALEGRTEGVGGAKPPAARRLLGFAAERAHEVLAASTPTQRASALNALAERLAAEIDGAAASGQARLRRLLVDISTRGLQPLIKQAQEDPQARKELEAILKADAQRLRKLSAALKGHASPEERKAAEELDKALELNEALLKALRGSAGHMAGSLNVDGKPNEAALEHRLAAAEAGHGRTAEATVRDEPVPGPADATKPAVAFASEALALADASGAGGAKEHGKSGEVQKGTPDNSNAGGHGKGHEPKAGGNGAGNGNGNGHGEGNGKPNPAGKDQDNENKTDRPAEKPEAGGNVDKPERLEAPERPDKPERAERPERPERPDKPEKPERPERPENLRGSDRPGHPDKGGGKGKKK